MSSPGMSSPGGMADLHWLVGEWHGRETIAPSAWGAGGDARSDCSYRLALDGRTLLHDYQAERDGVPWLSAHAVFAFNAASDEHNLFWFDSLGFVPAQPATGKRDGVALVFERMSPRGRTRHIWWPIDASRHGMKLESSFDDGASWVPVMEGTYARVA